MNAELIKRSSDAYLETVIGSDEVRLRFLQGVWEIQSSVESGAGPYVLPQEDAARDAVATGRPLFRVSTPQINLGTYLNAVERISMHCSEHAGLPAQEVEALGDMEFAAVLDRESLALAMESPHAFVDAVVEALAARPVPTPTSATIAFVLMSALTPFLTGPSHGLSELLGGFGQRAAGVGYCPVCGSAAELGRMGESTSLKGAERTLWCATCHAQWSIERIRCVRCGCRNPAKLRYTYVDGDAAHRVHLCDGCHGYTRFVFADDLSREASMEVEDAVTLALHGVASELGYSSAGDGGVKAC